MPCLNPRSAFNPKYRCSKKNGFNPPPCPDPRLLRITFDCGKCSECRRKRATHWRFRLHAEYKANPNKFHFVTFTFSDKALNALRSEFPVSEGYTDNDIAKVAVRRFLERYRKIYNVSCRHFFVTELGGKNGRIHLHGLLVGCQAGYWKRNKYKIDLPLLTSIWSYGYIWVGWCTDATISYVVKYITKQDPYHLDYRPVLLVSPGFGKCYVTSSVIKYHHSVPSGIYYLITSSGHKISMPRYYRDKIFTPEEILQRQLSILDNPPPLVYRGVIYASRSDLDAALAQFYVLTKSIRISDTLSRRIIKENFDFYI